uniref:MORN repeat variant n=1 Tax=Roseihalotalea indica TaxID=2867963 RepID=A0AA49Q071_9BACT|nr:hypothetical protein K4G66_16050 [Tunicatimonas sp. TK19036]
MYFLRFCFLISLVLLIGCDISVNDPATGSGSKSSSKKEGVVRKKRSDGTLATEITYQNQKKNGLAKYYYKNGKLRSEVMFKDDVKHGEAKLYYENEELYQVTNYVEGKKDGIQRKYRDDGRLMAEVPYQMDWAGMGLVEYTLKGKPKKQYPKLEVKTTDRTLKDNQYIIRASFSEPLKDVMYYVGDLSPKGFLHDELTRIAPKPGGYLEITYFVPPGTFLMEKLNIIAVGSTILKNPYVAQKSINIAVENKGF